MTLTYPCLLCGLFFPYALQNYFENRGYCCDRCVEHCINQKRIQLNRSLTHDECRQAVLDKLSKVKIIT